MAAMTSSVSLIRDPLIDLCFPEAHRGVGEEKYQLRPAPEEMSFPEIPQDPPTTNQQNLQDILPGISPCPWEPAC